MLFWVFWSYNVHENHCLNHIFKFVISDHQNGVHYLIPTMAERYIILFVLQKDTLTLLYKHDFQTSSSIVLSQCSHLFVVVILPL